MTQQVLDTARPVTLRRLAVQLTNSLDDGTLFNGARKRSFKATYKVTGSLQADHLERLRRKLLTKLTLNGRVVVQQKGEPEDGVTSVEVIINDRVP